MVERLNFVRGDEQDYYLIGDSGPTKNDLGRSIRDVRGTRVVDAWLDPNQACLHVVSVDPDTGKLQLGDFSLKNGASAAIIGLPKTNHNRPLALPTASNQPTLH